MARMHPVNLESSRTIDLLVDGLNPGEARRLGHGEWGDGGTMPLAIERLDENRFSLAHYGKQNGDLMADPDVELWRHPKTGRYYPVNMTQHYIGRFERAVIDWEDGQPHRFQPRTMRSISVFMRTWMKNVQRQQADGIKRLRSGERWVGHMPKVEESEPETADTSTEMADTETVPNYPSSIPTAWLR